MRSINPGDLLGLDFSFFITNIDELELCEILGNTDYSPTLCLKLWDGYEKSIRWAAKI